MELIWGELAKLGIVFLLLGGAVVYFYRREQAKDKQIADLNNELRAAERDNLQGMLKLISVIEKLDEREANSHKETLKEIQLLKESLTDKINSLRNG